MADFVTGWKLPTANDNVDYNNGGAWSSTTNIYVDSQATYAQSTLSKNTHYSDWLFASGYDFSEIPAFSEIVGIEVEIEVYSSDTGETNVYDELIQLCQSASAVGTNQGLTEIVSSAWETKAYGSATNTWGASLTRDDVVDSGFGVGFVYNNISTASTYTAYVNTARIRIHYNAGETIYDTGLTVCNAATGTSWVSLTNVYVNDGNATTYAISALTSSTQLTGTGYGLDFSIPAGSTIVGVQVDIDAWSSSSDTYLDTLKINTTGNGDSTTKTDASVYGTVDGDIRSYGGASDLWGYSSITEADIETISVEYIAKNTNGSGTRTVSVDVIWVTVYYTTSGGPTIYYGNALLQSTNTLTSEGTYTGPATVHYGNALLQETATLTAEGDYTAPGAVNTGWLEGTTASGTDWTNPTNAVTLNAVTADYLMPIASWSTKITVEGYDFSLIPVDATIDGIEVEITASGSSVSGVYLGSIGLYTTVNGFSSTETDAVVYTQALESRVYGANNDIWYASITREELQTLKTVYDAENTNSSNTRSVYLDSIRVKVHYTSAGGEVIHYGSALLQETSTLTSEGFYTAPASDGDTSYTTASSIVGVDWVDVDNARVKDDVLATYATAAIVSTTLLNPSAYALSIIPAGSTIDGIEVEVRAKSSASSNNYLDTIGVSTTAKGNSTTKTDALVYEAVLENRVYGGPTDLWGFTAPTRDDILTIKARYYGKSTTASNRTISVDSILVRIYYTDNGGEPEVVSSPMWILGAF